MKNVKYLSTYYTRAVTLSRISQRKGKFKGKLPGPWVQGFSVVAGVAEAALDFSTFEPLISSSSLLRFLNHRR